MATPQQPPQQPIYPRDLNLALDRNFAKFASYTDGRYDLLAAQLRIGNEESLIRDNDLVKQIRIGNEETLTRDNDLANSMRALADSLLRLAERVGTIETTQQTIINRLDAMQEQIKDGFAAQAERHNDLMRRVDKLERNGQN